MSDRNNRRVLAGEVVKQSGLNTYSVIVKNLKRHPVYQKVYRVSQKFLVHSECEHTVGEKVQIMSCRPISKMKRWRILDKRVK